MSTRWSSLLVTFLCAALFPLWSCAQSSPNNSTIEELARRTAERIAKTQAHHGLVLTLQGCLLDADICGSLNQKLRAEVQATVPDVQLLSRADMLPLLPKHGLLPVDGYTKAAEPAAADAGAEIMVSESLKWLEEGYEAETKVTSLISYKDLDDFKVKLARPALNSSTEALIFREPADGPALIIPRRQEKLSHAHWFATCDKCPEPPFTDEARAKKIEGRVLLVVTITDRGTAEHISVIRGLGAGLTESAVQAVRGWRFKPAVGPDGKPLPTRTPITVNFRLVNH